MTAEELNPEKILKLSGSYWETCTLHAGVKLNIFTIIGKDHLKGEDVAEKLNGDKRGVKTLLNALSAMDFLVKKEDTYANTSLSYTFLSKDSSKYMGHIVKHHHNLIDSWSKLDVAVRSGRSVRHRATHTDEEQRENFLMGMFNLAMNLAPILVPKVDLSGRRHLLDLGGGPGTYAIHFCMNNPRLKATVYDLPTTRPFAEKTIAKFNLQDRIDFKDVDYIEEEIKGIYDVVWLSHILHGEGPDDCRKIIGKSVSVLEPGGMILVHDFILNNSMDGPLFPALFSLNMLLGTPLGRSYSEKQIEDMLSDAGVGEIRRIFFESPNDSGIISGIV
ncbi:MAG: methyltransferase [Desulfobacterales bacterium]|jgi:predicted transcriptional regulator/predicted O-methyltransferase YrrM